MTADARKIVAITGGAGGIGRGIAVAFAREGYDVATFDLPETADASAETVSTVEELDRTAVSVPVDITDVARIPEALAECVDALGLPSVWVNNAGVVVRKPALEVTYDDWRRVLDVCLTGSFFCAQAFARRIIEAGASGSIVNVSSIYGLVGGPNRAAYSTAKAGLVNLTRVLAYEWDPYGIRVNAVAPSFVKTPMTADLVARGLDVPNRSLESDLVLVDDVARAVCFLAGPEAQRITGHTLPVDGGWLSW